MKIKVNKESLQRSFSTADVALSSKAVNPVLSNCHIRVENNKMIIMATDNEIAVRTSIDALCSDSLSFLVNGKKFNSILKELPNDEVEITIDDSQKIRLKSMSSDVKGHYDIIGMSAQDYPDIPEFVADNAVTFDQALFKNMLKNVMYAASHDTIKPVFNGIYLISEDDQSLSIVATDSRRLTLATRMLESSNKITEGIIIPLKTMHEIYRQLGTSGDCIFSMINKQCFFKIGNVEIVSRIVDGQFPNFRQVIPKEFLFTAIIDTQKFMESLRRALVFTKEPVHKVIMHFKKDTLTITAQTPDLGEAEEEILIDCQGNADISIGVNVIFMIDALKEIESQTVTCGITGQMSPISLQPSDDEQIHAVVMPIQIKS